MDKHEKFEAQLDTSSLLARIDERTEFLVREITEIKDSLKTNYVEQSEFKPVKQIVFSAVKLVLLSVLGALLYLVVKS
ncbi:MAG: hypothetical protein Q7R95_06125 [bacterium]|nr:hypothetical protein [bacterium]